MTIKYLHMQSIVNYRIPIKEDGKLGTPEIINKWTTEMGAPKKKKPLKKKEIKKEVSKAIISEVEF